MILSHEDIYLFRSLLCGKISQLEQITQYAKKQDDYKEVFNKKDIPYKGKKISFNQYKKVVDTLLNQLNGACKKLKLNVPNPQIDPLLEKYKDRLSPKIPFDETKEIHPDDLAIYVQEVEVYIKTYQFWKDKIVTPKDWGEQKPNMENAFGLELTSDQVLEKAKQKLIELQA